jgi:hypothetical protein
MFSSVSPSITTIRLNMTRACLVTLHFLACFPIYYNLARSEFYHTAEWLQAWYIGGVLSFVLMSTVFDIVFAF